MVKQEIFLYDQVTSILHFHCTMPLQKHSEPFYQQPTGRKEAIKGRSITMSMRNGENSRCYRSKTGEKHLICALI